MKKKLLILPAVGVGVLALILMVRCRKEPAVSPVTEVPAQVRTIPVPRLKVVPRAVGYGVVRPGRVWQAVAEVGGRIIELSPRVKEGNFIEVQAKLVQIDRTDYDLEVAGANAVLATLRAQLEELDTRKDTLDAALEIEAKSLALAQAELDRIRHLVERESLPLADLDREHRSVLSQNRRVQELESQVSLLTPQRKVLEAQIKQETSRLEKAELSVARATISAPFRGRFGTVQVEQQQVVLPGQVLFSLDSIATSEVTAQVPVRGLRRIMTGGTARIDPLNVTKVELSKLGLSAKVRFESPGGPFEWDAQVVRVQGIDPQTRTIGIDVAVEGPYADLVPGIRPPLVRDLYVEVEILGRPREGQVVIPRFALHGSMVHLVGTDSRLKRQHVEVSHVQSHFAVVTAGLEGGEQLVVSDLMPAAEGTLLDPQVDEEAVQALRADAVGETPVR